MGLVFGIDDGSTSTYKIKLPSVNRISRVRHLTQLTPANKSYLKSLRIRLY